MLILLVNLKHLYQRRGLWILYTGLGFIAWFVVEKAFSAPAKESGLFGGFLVTTFMMISWTPLAPYRMISPTLAFAGTALSWGLCLSLLYRIAMHRDLVRQ